jgi:hypothetical protein
MHNRIIQLGVRKPALVVGVSLCLLTALGACSGENQLTVPLAPAMEVPTGTAIAAATSTVIGTPVEATRTPNAKELAAAHVTQTIAALRTSVAETALPTWTPGGAPIGPSATPALGLFRDCPSKNSGDLQIATCWRGVVDGNIANVDAGREGRDGDPDQGVVTVYVWGSNSTQIIDTPDKVGAVQITAIDGTLFTLTTVDHTPTITYTFDLSTRQWVSPPLTPSPSVSPLPSVTP